MTRFLRDTFRPVKRLTATLSACALFGCGAAWAQADDLAVSHTLYGGRFEYTVQNGDSLTGIGARFGESARDIAQINGIPFNSRLFPGQRLDIDNRHVVPAGLADGIVVNLPQRMLFLFQGGELMGAYPVGLGKPSWPTPSGEFHVVELRKHPIWFVPVSIQEEMRLKDKEVKTQVPPGKDNPLGDYWIGLSMPGYGIHGTNAPPSVYHFQSHGCIRLQPDAAELVFSQVRVGMPGKILYTPLLLARLEDGRIYLEVNRDVYKLGGNKLEDLRTLAAANDLTDRIDWQKAAQVVELREGIARQIDMQANATESKGDIVETKQPK